MKILLDACVWGGAKESLAAAGHEVEWAGDWESDPGDEEILAYADKNQCVLVTLDKDFGELAVVFQKPHRGIVRLVDFSATRQGPAAAEVLATHAQLLFEGAIITVEQGRIRVRPGTES